MESDPFKAIADPNRLRIIEALLKHGYCVGALARSLGISEAAASQHLKVLRHAGLVEGVKKGYYVHYSVNRNELVRMAERLLDMAAIEQKPCGAGGLLLLSDGCACGPRAEDADRTDA